MGAATVGGRGAGDVTTSGDGALGEGDLGEGDATGGRSAAGAALALGAGEGEWAGEGECSTAGAVGGRGAGDACCSRRPVRCSATGAALAVGGRGEGGWGEGEGECSTAGVALGVAAVGGRGAGEGERGEGEGDRSTAGAARGSASAVGGREACWRRRLPGAAWAAPTASTATKSSRSDFMVPAGCKNGGTGEAGTSVLATTLPASQLQIFTRSPWSTMTAT